MLAAWDDSEKGKTDMRKRTIKEWQELSNQLGDIVLNVMAASMMAAYTALIAIISIGLILSIYNLIK